MNEGGEVPEKQHMDFTDERLGTNHNLMTEEPNDIELSSQLSDSKNNQVVHK
mgnify:CR=1 FL=1